MFVSVYPTMNDGNIKHYLIKEADKLARKIQDGLCAIKYSEQHIEDMHGEITKWKAHYTSLINSLLAYDETEESIKDAGYAIVE